jgi:GTPase SAR1 family protein
LARSSLSSIFSLVIVGEFNSGKSSLINAMLGDRFLDMGVTPTTAKVTVLRELVDGEHDGEEASVRVVSETDQVRTVEIASELLSQVCIVDTPGTNAIVANHTELTRDFIPNADAILFVTSCDRAFSASEKAFLVEIAKWTKKIICVLSKADILEGPEEEAKLIDFVRTSFRDHLKLDNVPIFPIAGRNALRARKAGDTTAFAESKLEAFEEYLKRTLDAPTRCRLKLDAAIAVARKVARDDLAALRRARSTIESDVINLQHVSERLTSYNAEIEGNFHARLDRVDNVVLELGTRARRFVEDHLRIGQAISVVTQQSRLRTEYNDDVVATCERDVERIVGDTVEWLAARHADQWSSVVQFANERVAQLSAASAEAASAAVSSDDAAHAHPFAAAAFPARTAGAAAVSSSEQRRQSLLNSLSTAAHDVLARYDAKAVGATLAADLSSSVQTTAAVSASVAGLATVLTATLVDTTGFLGASVVGLGAFAYLPYKRRALSQDIDEQISKLRSSLRAELQSHFDSEMDAAREALTVALEPYRTFVSEEETRINRLEATLNQVLEDLKKIEARVAHEFPTKQGTKE